ncbi:hypothetical protein [Actinomadura sp. 9N407]|uniref:hypothetical protein n=1 Tax=Actinomadura sp. 9N407 TaxID=3375154 RepID=UPI00379C50C5
MTNDHDRLRALFPSWHARPDPAAVERGLVGIPAAAIADLVLDGDEPFWRRDACGEALIGRVPDERALELVAHACDDEISHVLGNALVTALNVPGRPYRDALRERAVERGNYDIAEKLGPRTLVDEAATGDATALRLLAVLASAPWRHLREAGRKALDELIERRGLPAFLDMLGAASPTELALSGAYPAERLLGLRFLRDAGGDIAPCLGDDAAIVCRAAYDLLLAGYGGDGTLLAMVEEERPGHLWALPILRERGHDVRPLWERLGSPRVEVPGVPPDVREAIVRRFAPGQAGTDPRWLIEAALLAPSPPPEEEHAIRVERLRAACTALVEAGLNPQDPVPVGKASGSGHGTYDIVATDAGKVWVSTLGPFFGHPGDARIVTALQGAGFRYVDAELREVMFTGLAVYFFGSRDPLKVGDLVFYWQD